MSNREKITFLIMTKKGFGVIENLLQNDKKSFIDKVIIGRDNNVENDYSDDIEKLCKNNDITYYYRSEKLDITSKYAIAISWRWIINNKNTRLIVLHDSLLPKYRGFAPLVNALINNESTVGVTALFASESYDKGDIIAQSELKIEYPIKIGALIDMITKNYNEIVMELIGCLEKDKKFESTEQCESIASYSLWLDEEDYLVDWDNNSEDIVRFINATGEPYKGAASYIGKEKVRIIEAEVFPDVKIENRTSGKVIFKEKNALIVVCGKGLLKINKMKYDSTNKDVLPIKNFRIRFKNK